MESKTEIRFDGWVLLRDSGELFRDGQRIRLQDQPLQVLEALLAEPGRLVTREQLIARLWPRQVVDFDTALNAAVRRLRAALGDEAETPKYIETIPRRGYRFIGTLDPPSPPTAEASDAPAPPAPDAPEFPQPPAGEPGHPRRHLRPGIAAMAVALAALATWALWPSTAPNPGSPGTPQAQAGPPRIVVLPFADFTPDGTDRYLADGLTEELIHRLARSESLSVIARTSAFALRGQDIDVPGIARRLDVTHVLEGSVRRAGERLRVTAQLIDASTNAHLWSENYDRRMGDVLAIQDDIARSVAQALQARLEVPRPASAVDARAYEQAQLARFLLNRRMPGDLERAQALYEEAVASDPGFAQAWSGLASVYFIRVFEGDVPREAGLPKVREAANRALEIDPGLAEPHVRLATVAWVEGDAETSATHWDEAIALEPNHPLVLGHAVAVARNDGRLERAVELQYRIVELDPLSAVSRYNLAWELYHVADYERAVAELERYRQLRPGEPVVIECHALLLLGRHDEALARTRTWTGAFRDQCDAMAYHSLGRRAESDAAMARLVAASADGEPLLIAEARAWRGEADAAFEWLEKARRHCLTTAMFPAQCVTDAASTSPMLESLRSDPRWPAWRQKEF